MKIPVTNNTQNYLPVGATLIPPGETRHFEEEDVPHHLRPNAPTDKPAEPPVDPLVELLKGNVPSVVAALDGMLIADIERLSEIEMQGQYRKGVLGPIAAILLNNAQNTEMRGKVAALSDEELAAALLTAGTDINADTAYVAALETEQTRRLAV